MCRDEQPSRAELQNAVAGLRETVTAQSSQIAALLERVATLESENAALRERLGPGDPPAGVRPRKHPDWVKGNVPPAAEEAPKERKRRDQSFARRREEPTRVVELGAACCPDCGRPLKGGEVASSHQVLEIPAVRYEVIEVRRLRRWCGVCGKRVAPPPVPPELSVGRHRFGPRLMAFVANAVTVGRQPHRGVQRQLEELYGLRLSVGSITAMLRTVAERGRGQYEALLAAIRESPVVHADETGWRENGRNGILWALVTPDARFLHRDASRGRSVIESLLGEEAAPILVTDFYSAYTGLPCPHQYCWAHLLRAGHELKESLPTNRAVRRWTDKLHAFYLQSVGLAARVAAQPEPARQRARANAERKLLQLANWRVARDGAARTLGERIRRHGHELVTFIEHPEVPPDNNAAERALRPAVIARKCCGGTRSPTGTDTKTILLSLFGTWLVRGQSPLAACHALLTTPTIP
jgi:transposase